MNRASDIFVPERRKSEDLKAFRASVPHSATLTVFNRFAGNLERQIPQFDSDEGLELVLRFPGLPDAIAGSIRGMQSYCSWLYYQIDEDGRKHGYHYSRFEKSSPVEDYRKLLEEVLGRSIEVKYDSTPLDTLNLRDEAGKDWHDAMKYEYSLTGGAHDRVKAVIFDLDNTLAATDGLVAYRRNRDQAGMEHALRRKVPEVDQALRQVLHEVSRTLPVAVVTVAPQWYAARLLSLLFPGVAWTAIVTYEDVVRHKPFPDAFRLAAERMQIDSADILVVGDSRDDVEAAYHAGMQVALVTWHCRDEEGLLFIPDAVFEGPRDLLQYLNSPALCLPFLEAWLMDEDWEALEWGEPFPATTNVPGQPKLTVGVLGRYFPNYDQTLGLHEKHLLSRQIIAKERPEPFEVPEAWIYPLSTIISRQDVDVVTVIPAKPGKDRRLERILKLLRTDGAMEYLPDLLAFTPGMRDVKRLPAAEKYAEVSSHLGVTGPCKGKRVLVIDDVLTQGATMQAATDKLMAAGASAVERIAIAKTVSPFLFRERDEIRHCKNCGAIMAHRRRKSDQKTFWSCSQHFKTGCEYIENED